MNTQKLKYYTNMEFKQTSAEWLASLMMSSNSLPYQTVSKYVESAKTVEVQNAIAFHKWMRENDTPENAEQYFHFTDEDMYNEWINTQNRYTWQLSKN